MIVVDSWDVFGGSVSCTANISLEALRETLHCNTRTGPKGASQPIVDQIITFLFVIADNLISGHLTFVIIKSMFSVSPRLPFKFQAMI